MQAHRSPEMSLETRSTYFIDHLMLHLESEFESWVMCECTTSLPAVVDQSPSTI